MSVFDHVNYPFHHDHINTPRKHPLITPFELQLVGVSHENWGGGVITPRPSGGLDKSLISTLRLRPRPRRYRVVNQRSLTAITQPFSVILNKNNDVSLLLLLLFIFALNLKVVRKEDV